LFIDGVCCTWSEHCRRTYTFIPDHTSIAARLSNPYGKGILPASTPLSSALEQICGSTGSEDEPNRAAVFLSTDKRRQHYYQDPYLRATDSQSDISHHLLSTSALIFLVFCFSPSSNHQPPFFIGHPTMLTFPLTHPDTILSAHHTYIIRGMLQRRKQSTIIPPSRLARHHTEPIATHNPTCKRPSIHPCPQALKPRPESKARRKPQLLATSLHERGLRSPGHPCPALHRAAV
jgi:hypothetical protein